MRRRRKPDPQPPTTEIVPVEPPKPAVDDRAWSARRSLGEREARQDLVPYMALPAETGPTWAPDELSIWPVEGGRFGLDARYTGASGATRAAQQAVRLERLGLYASVRDDGMTLRHGPLTPHACWVAIEAFLGRPIEE